MDEHRRDDIEFVPHLRLGLFIKQGSKYDWDNPQSAEFDDVRYEEALQQAKALPLDCHFVVDRLHLVAIPSEVLEWATGRRETIPGDVQFAEVQEFPLAGE